MSIESSIKSSIQEVNTFRRRELFGQSGNFRIKKDTNNPVTGVSSEARTSKLTRKKFLYTTAALGGTLLATSIVNVDTSQAQIEQSIPLSNQEQPNKNQSFKIEDITSQLSDNNQNPDEQKPSYWDTFKESTVLNAGGNVLGEVLKKIGVPIGNAYLEEKNKKLSKETTLPLKVTPLPRLILYVGVAKPIEEETIFRLLPSSLLDLFGSKGTNWEAGTVTTVLFALMHNITWNGQTKELGFAKNRIPLIQGIYGTYLWRNMRERGFFHALLTHSTFNTETFTLGRLLLKIKERNNI